jgi:hypothetical protein
MKRVWLRPLLPALALTALAGAAEAQVVIRAPGVFVQVGRPIVVQAPGARVIVSPPGGPAAPAPVFPVAPTPLPVDPGAPPPVPLEGVPVRPVPPVVPGTVVPGPRVMTVAEFAASFHPSCGGNFEVVLQHPCTCQPVKVCFHLPRCPKRVCVVKGGLQIRYGLCKAVAVRFCPDGGVRVLD